MTEFLFVAKSATEGRPVLDSSGNQTVLVLLKEQGNYYVVIRDSIVKRTFVERLNSILLLDPYRSDNFRKIEDDQEWESIYNILQGRDIEMQ